MLTRLAAAVAAIGITSLASASHGSQHGSGYGPDRRGHDARHHAHYRESAPHRYQRHHAHRRAHAPSYIPPRTGITFRPSRGVSISIGTGGYYAPPCPPVRRPVIYRPSPVIYCPPPPPCPQPRWGYRYWR